VQAIGTFTQSHRPFVCGRQAWLVGQTPPHAGNPLVWHGCGWSMQPQSVEPGIGWQTSPFGQTPPHRGAVVCEQSTMISTQLQ
jgi:hypothetical protein